MESPVEPPERLREHGSALWRDVMAVYELTAPERRMLAQVCATLDVVVDLETVVEAEGVVSEGSTGQRTVHPAVLEARQQRLAFGRLLAQLALPDPEGGVIRTPGQVRAVTAADARWRGERRGA